MRIVPLLLFALLATDPPATFAQDATPPPPLDDLVAWLGVEPGDTFAYRTADEGEVCVPVRKLAAGLALEGFPWPDASTPLDLVFSMDDAPAVGWARPGARGAVGAVSPLLPNVKPRRGTAPSPGDGTLEAGPGAPVPVGWPVATGDGWYAYGGTPGSPERLVYVRCTACMDAGLRVVMERGRGIVSVRTTTIVGSTRVLLARRGCATGESPG